MVMDPVQYGSKSEHYGLGFRVAHDFCAGAIKECAADSSLWQRTYSRSKPLTMAFAALVGDGSVVTWGDDENMVTAVLSRISSRRLAVLLLLFLTWICRNLGCSRRWRAAQDQLKNAILGDGSVVTWVSTDDGGVGRDGQHS